MQKLKQWAPSVLRWFLVAWFCLTLPAVILLSVNEYARFTLVEMANHYISRVQRLEYVFIGDSITAQGRNWGWRISHNPFSSRNLGCSGYTIHQVRTLVPQALAYHPRWVIVMAGTNDILDEENDRNRMVQEYRLMLASLKEGRTKPMVTLMPHMASGKYAAEINAFNSEIRKLCAEQSVPVVDLNPIIAPDGKLLPQFTLDGVHLSERAYTIWVAQLKDLFAQ